MHLRTCLPAVAIALTLIGCQHPALAPAPVSALAPTGLHSPWDQTPITQTATPYTCGPAPLLSRDLLVIASLDDNRKHLSEDVKNAVYAQSSTALLDLTSRVVAAADNYRATGSEAAGVCVLGLLGSAAQSHAMTGYMASDDAWVEQNRSLRAFSIAYLKVRDHSVTHSPQAADIIPWMEEIVRQERTHYEHEHCGANICSLKGHHGIEVAMAAATIGVAANDNGLFHWSLGMYHSAIGEINGRGMLHYDSRGHYSFKDNLMSAAALVQIAELAEINGEPLYGFDNGAIHLLVHTVALGIVSPELYKVGGNKSNQRAPRTVEPWEIAWASVYNRRFPDPVVTSLLQQVGPGGVDMWGGEPWNPEGEPSPEKTN